MQPCGVHTPCGMKASKGRCPLSSFPGGSLRRVPQRQGLPSRVTCFCMVPAMGGYPLAGIINTLTNYLRIMTNFYLKFYFFCKPSSCCKLAKEFLKIVDETFYDTIT